MRERIGASSAARTFSESGCSRSACSHSMQSASMVNVDLIVTQVCLRHLSHLFLISPLRAGLAQRRRSTLKHAGFRASAKRTQNLPCLLQAKSETLREAFGEITVLKG